MADADTKNFLKSLIKKCPVFKPETEMSYYDDIIAKPEYHEQVKGISYAILDLTPDEYMYACQTGFGDWRSAGVDDWGIENYKKDMERGDKFPLITLEYGTYYQSWLRDPEERRTMHPKFSQEGRHRALASKGLCDKIPVMVVYPTDEKEFDVAMLKMSNTVLNKLVRERKKVR